MKRIVMEHNLNYRKAINVLLLLTLCVMTAVLAIKRMYSFDIWWHLATGKWIFEHLSLPSTDPFSFTFAGRPWINDYEWLFQLIIYPVFVIAGIPGIVFFKAAVFVSALLILYLALKKIPVDTFTALVLVLLVLLSASTRVIARPVIFSFLFISFFWYCISIFRQSTRTIKPLLFLIPVYIMWMFIHSSYVIVPLIVGALFVEQILIHPSVQAIDALRIPGIRNAAIFTGIIALLTALNPYSWHVLKTMILSGQQAQDTINFVQEWRPFPFREFFMYFWNVYLFVKIIFLLLLCGVAWGLRKKENLVLVPWIVWSLILVWLMYRHMRFIAFFAFGSAPVVAILWNNIKYRQPVFLVIAALSILFSAHFLFNSDWKRSWGPDVLRSRYPMDTVSLIQKKGVPQPIFNTYEFGGYLIWNLFPDYKVFIDGRTLTLYTDNFYWKYRMITSHPAESYKKLLDYDIRTFIIKRKELKLAKYLVKEQNFVLAGFDDISWLLVQKDSVPDGLGVFEVMTPTDDLKKMTKDLDEHQLEKLREELRRAVRLAEYSVAPYLMLGKLESIVFEDNQAAYSLFLKALKIQPDNISLFKELGLTAFNMKRYEKAALWLDKVVDRLSRDKKVIQYAGRANLHIGNYKKAYKLTREFFRLKGDSTDPYDYQYMGVAAYETGHYGEARDYLQRAIMLNEDKKLEKILLYNLGNCYAANKNFKDASSAYKKALTVDPGYKDAAKALQELTARAAAMQ